MPARISLALVRSDHRLGAWLPVLNSTHPDAPIKTVARMHTAKCAIFRNWHESCQWFAKSPFAQDPPRNDDRVLFPPAAPRRNAVHTGRQSQPGRLEPRAASQHRGGFPLRCRRRFHLYRLSLAGRARGGDQRLQGRPDGQRALWRGTVGRLLHIGAGDQAA